MSCISWLNLFFVRPSALMRQFKHNTLQKEKKPCLCERRDVIVSTQMRPYDDRPSIPYLEKHSWSPRHTTARGELFFFHTATIPRKAPICSKSHKMHIYEKRSKSMGTIALFYIGGNHSQHEKASVAVITRLKTSPFDPANRPRKVYKLSDFSLQS